MAVLLPAVRSAVNCQTFQPCKLPCHACIEALICASDMQQGLSYGWDFDRLICANPPPKQDTRARAYARLSGLWPSSVWREASLTLLQRSKKKGALQSVGASLAGHRRGYLHPESDGRRVACKGCRRPPTSRRRPACRAPSHRRPRRRARVAGESRPRAARCEGATGAFILRVSRARCGGMML